MLLAKKVGFILFGAISISIFLLSNLKLIYWLHDDLSRDPIQDLVKSKSYGRKLDVFQDIRSHFEQRSHKNLLEAVLDNPVNDVGAMNVIDKDKHYVGFEFYNYIRIIKTQLKKLEANYQVIMKDSNPKLASLFEKCHKGYKKDEKYVAYLLTANDFFAPTEDSLLADQYLNDCYPIEISVSQFGRSTTQCLDFVQFVIYAGARLSPEFHYTVYEEKAKRCPTSIFLHGDQVIEPLFEGGVRNYWMPTVDLIRKNQAKFIYSADTLIAKTKMAAKALKDAFPSKRVVLIQLSTPEFSIPAQDRDFDRFFYNFNLNNDAITDNVLDCWKKHPEWPELVIFGQDATTRFFNDESQESEKSKKPDNIRLNSNFSDHRSLQRKNSIHLCPSVMDGFGHYINDARIMGCMFITSDYGPMNEFSTGNETLAELYIKTDDPKGFTADYQLIERLQFRISSDAICDAVQKIINMSTESREMIGNRNRRAYEQEQQMMMLNMKFFSWEAMEIFNGHPLEFHKGHYHAVEKTFIK